MADASSYRIPTDFIDLVLDRADIVEVIDSHVKLKSSGRNYSACCPFHQEKTPSFSVEPNEQFYYCFGCGMGGNVISFLMEYNRVSFPEAVEYLAQRAGLTMPKPTTHLSPQALAAQQAKNDARHHSYMLLDEVSAYFQTQLRQHPQHKQAQDYLKNRGMSGSIAKRFGIGYAPPGWQNLVNALGMTPQGLSGLVDNGLVKQENNKTYDFFRQRIMFPIRNHKGKVIAFGGRVLDDSKPKYLNSPETQLFQKERELYGLYEARQHRRQLNKILVVEGYTDVVALAQHGIDYAVATLGTSISHFHLERVFKYVDEVVFCFDGDEAGTRAAVRAMRTVIPMMSAGRQARFLLLPEGQDPDSLVKQVGADNLTKQINQAMPFSEFLFAQHTQHLDMHNIEHKSKLAKDILPLIKAMPADIMQALMMDKLSQVTGMEKDVIEQLSIALEGEEVFSKQTLSQGSHQKERQTQSLPSSAYWDDEMQSGMAANNRPDEMIPPDNLPPVWSDGVPSDHPLGANRPISNSVMNLAQQGIYALLQTPVLAKDYEQVPDHLLNLTDNDSQILVWVLQQSNQVADIIGRHPTKSEFMAECKAHKHWPYLQALDAREKLSLEQDLSPIMAALAKKAQQQKIRQLQQQLSDPAITTASKHDLIQQINQLKSALLQDI